MELLRSGINGSRCGARIISITHEWGFAVIDTQPTEHVPELGMPSSGGGGTATAHFSLNRGPS
jgi:hypothetical protein